MGASSAGRSTGLRGRRQNVRISDPVEAWDTDYGLGTAGWKEGFRANLSARRNRMPARAPGAIASSGRRNAGDRNRCSGVGSNAGPICTSGSRAWRASVNRLIEAPKTAPGDSRATAIDRRQSCRTAAKRFAQVNHKRVPRTPTNCGRIGAERAPKTPFSDESSLYFDPMTDPILRRTARPHHRRHSSPPLPSCSPRPPRPPAPRTSSTHTSPTSNARRAGDPGRSGRPRQPRHRDRGRRTRRDRPSARSAGASPRTTATSSPAAAPRAARSSTRAR